MSVVGFDFGTESCIISVCRRGGLDVLQNEVGNRKTSSMVAFSGNQRYIGDSAVSQSQGNWKNTITSFKNLLRVSRVDHPDFKAEKQFMPFKLVDRGEGEVGVEVRYDYKKEILAPQQITGAMLQKLKTTAEAGLNTRVVDCVLSVPPTWTESARRALLDSSKIAGLNVLRLMNESSAVALTYGILRQLPPNPINVLFVDVGASHTNATVVEFKTGKLQVLSVDSDYHLGGRNFDKLIFDHLADLIKKKYKMDVSTNQKACLKLMKASKKTKMTLSANNIVPFGVEYLMNDTDVKGQITRQEFEELSVPLVARLTPLLDGVLLKAGVEKSALHSLEIVGGGSRIPSVQNALKAWYGGVLSKTCDGDESVARGCALQCAMLSPLVKVREFNVVDTQPFDVKVEWGAVSADPSASGELNSLNFPLFAACKDPLPCVKMVSFTGHKEAFQIVSSYAEPSAIPSGANAHIGRYVLGGFPAASELTDDQPKVKVEFNMDLHGCFTMNKAVLMQLKPEEKEAEPMDTKEDGKAADTKEKAKDSKDMDTSSDDKTAEKKEPTKKKKKYNRTPLTFQAWTLSLDEKTRATFYERECAMSNQDRVIAETSLARDMLERYVLEMKGRVDSRDDLANYITDAEKSVFHQKLVEEDDWLISDEGYDAQKSVYKTKLADLHKYGSPVVTRHYEHRERKAAVDTLKKMVVFYQTFVSSDDEKFAHITAEQRAPAGAKCSEIDQWLATELTRQEQMALNVNPVLTKAILIAKAKELGAVCKPIKNTAKPKPPPKEEKPAETTEEK